MRQHPPLHSGARACLGLLLLLAVTTCPADGCGGNRSDPVPLQVTAQPADTAVTADIGAAQPPDPPGGAGFHRAPALSDTLSCRATVCGQLGDSHSLRRWACMCAWSQHRASRVAQGRQPDAGVQ